MKHCPNCGIPLTEEIIFCPNCGNQIPSDSTEEHIVAEPHKGGWGRALLFVAVAVALVGALTLGILRVMANSYTLTATTMYENALCPTDTRQIYYTLTSESGKNPKIKWVSTDESVATVQKTGKVTAVNVGTAEIRAYLWGKLMDSVTVEVVPRMVSLENGQMMVTPAVSGECEITIKAIGDTNRIVYLKHTSDSNKDFAVYVRSNSTATVSVAEGDYALYYASGTVWYGAEFKFQNRWSFYKLNDLVSLSMENAGEVTLPDVPSGHVEGDEITEDQFPM